MPVYPTNSEAPYLSRSLRAVLVPPSRSPEVRAVLVSGGVRLLPGEKLAARTHVIDLADDADLDLVAGILRDYEGWPH